MQDSTASEMRGGWRYGGFAQGLLDSGTPAEPGAQSGRARGRGWELGPESRRVRVERVSGTGSRGHSARLGMRT